MKTFEVTAVDINYLLEFVDKGMSVEEIEDVMSNTLEDETQSEYFKEW